MDDEWDVEYDDPEAAPVITTVGEKEEDQENSESESERPQKQLKTAPKQDMR